MDKTALKYKDCYVAFIDILGFKNIICNQNCTDIKDIFDEILNFESQPMINSMATELHNHIMSYVMSDSVVMYIETKFKGAFVALTEACLQMQIKLANHDDPIMVRGGISRGNLYRDGNVIFGPGLTNAYILEKSLAKYPRIVFLDETRQSALDDMDIMYLFDYNHMFYRTDDDMLNYLYYMNTFAYVHSLKELSHEKITDFNIRYFERLYLHTKRELCKGKDPTIREKYLWLLKEINYAIGCRPEVKDYFDEKRRKEQEESDMRFDDALKDNERL